MIGNTCTYGPPWVTAGSSREDYLAWKQAEAAAAAGSSVSDYLAWQVAQEEALNAVEVAAQAAAAGSSVSDYLAWQTPTAPRREGGGIEVPDTNTFLGAVTDALGLTSGSSGSF